MRKTLLELTQDILSSMDGDEVNTISDSTESLQVAKIIETTYWDIIARAEFPKNYTFFTLSASGNPSQPTIMYLPDTKLTIEWIRYNIATVDQPSADFRDVQFLALNDFVTRMYQHNSEEDSVDSFNFTVPAGDTITVLARNDKFPEFYTTFDDKTLLFDSYNSSEDTTLQESKTLCYGEKIPTFTVADGFTPDLPPKAFSLLYNEAKSQCWADLKQSQNVKAEQRARKSWVNSQKSKRNVNNPRSELDRVPNYGRNGC